LIHEQLKVSFRGLAGRGDDDAVHKRLAAAAIGVLERHGEHRHIGRRLEVERRVAARAEVIVLRKQIALLAQQLQHAVER
jgi:hypothetical protein